MYKIFADDTLIYDSTLEDFKIGKGQVTLETDKSGSFVFSLYPDHPYYDAFVKMRTVITVYKSNRIVFRGRVLNDATDYWNNKVLTCEGELGFLQDSIIRPYEFTGTPVELFTQLVEAHNRQVGAFKRFKVGTCTVVDPNGYIVRSNEGYESALSNMTSRLLEDTTGGHFYITHGDDGTDETPTIHYLADFTKEATQAIEFGSNLKKYTKKTNAADIATAIIPQGATINYTDPTGAQASVVVGIAGVNDGVDYVYSEAGVALYDWIFQTVKWDDVTDATILLAKAKEYVKTVIEQAVTLELTAIDLHLLDRSIDSFNVDEYVRVYSEPHNFAASLLCKKQTLNLLKPENDTVTLGHTYSTFTETASKASHSAVQQLKATISGLSSQLASYVVRLEALEGVTVLVTVTDSAGSVDALLNSYGVLTVAGNDIAQPDASVVVTGGTATVMYVLSTGLSAARTVIVNGTQLGTVVNAGDSVTGSVAVVSGSEITVEFKSA